MLAPAMDDSAPIHCVIEVPMGSRNKYEWDPELGAIKLDRFLFSSIVYPTDYGFIPATLNQKGEPLDAMVCVSEPTFPGCHIPVNAIGIFRVSDEDGQDDKLLCVPHDDPGWSHIEDLDGLPQQLRSEIEHFFSIYKTPEGRLMEVKGWDDRKAALAELEAGQRRFREESS
jgi:inorganic pyrophosphatase